MHKGTVFVIAATAIAGGYYIGRAVRSPSDSGGTTAMVGTPGSAVPGDVERKRVPLAGTAKGPADALVNIVEFSDFQCPFCTKVNPTLEQLMKENPGKVRVFFRHFPLDFHQDAPLASEAAIAAGDQGKFWEMHDKLFANQQALKRPDLEKYAQELGLDMGKFKQALDSRTHKAKVDADMAAGRELGVQGTPNFFINGRPLRGAYPYAEFKKIVDEELATAQKLIAAGTKPAQVYAKLMAGSGTAAPTAAPAAPTAPKAPPTPTEVYKVEVGKAYTKGGKQPKVTIVEFSEFQCPFCSRAKNSVDEIAKKYGDDVQIAFKHFPLPFHNNAVIASQAALAAGEQGKFWEMHDKLFANQQALDRPNLEKYAQELGLDMGKFKAFLDGEKGKAVIEGDVAQGQKLGVRGTPMSFINGRMLRGAQPTPNWMAVIDEEMKKADELLKAGTPRAKLYAEVTKNGREEAPKEAPPQPQAQRPGEPAPGEVYRAEIQGAPSKGPKDALITIVQFSDYECPFCARVEPTIDRVMDEYKGKVRVVWRDLPLPFHNNAMPAAIAARVAGEQGKFWDMHKKLFANQKALDRPSLEKYAQELGLNMGKFKAALDQQKYKAEIEADTAMGAKIGARGTPAFFINGTFLSGAQPFEAFKARIDDELKKAEALVAKGTPKAKVYETLMKTAKTEVAAAAPAAQPQAAQAGPEADQKVWDVKPGNAASRGPKNAPITMVVFSEFQCPFCSRVKPTLDQIEKDYPGKVRVVFKHYPLPFHNNAKIASEAALAAGEQGKFWQMHDKLFANQQALDRPNLEKYAQELGLDMAKFKAALDSNKFAAQIEADMKEATAVEVNGTPATFINGRKIPGAYPLDTFKKIVDQELAKAGGAKARKKVAVNE